MKETEELARALADHSEAQDGVDLAQTALLSALVSALRAKGVLTQAEVNIVFDSALVGVENSPVITEETTRRARLMLEQLAREMGGTPRPNI
jgi:hypothetical protein